MASKIEISYVKNFDLCDWDHFYIVKGISILAALVSYYCSAFLNIPGMQHISLIAGAIFALCSGYGVAESFHRKGSLVHYWENKIVKVWLSSFIVMVVFSYMQTRNIVGWIGDSPLALKGDMLYVIFAGYAAFWLALRITEDQAARTIALFAILAAVFCFVPENISVKKVILAFPVGVVFSQQRWKHRIRKYRWMGKLTLMGICGAVAAAGWVLASIVTLPYCPTVLWSVAYTAIGAFVIFGIYFLKAIPVWGIFVPFGMASYGLYLLYEPIMAMMKGKSDWRMVAILAVALCAGAAILTVLRELLITWNRKLRRNKSPKLKGSMW